MAGDLRELITLEQMRGQRRDGASRLLRAAWAEIARLQEEAIAREGRLAEVEALLAAERERCARAVLKYAAGFASGVRQSRADEIAAAIRSLAPQTIGGEE